LPVLEASDDRSVGLAVQGALISGGVHIVLARSDRTANVALHDDLHRIGLAAAADAGWLRA